MKTEKKELKDATPLRKKAGIQLKKSKRETDITPADIQKPVNEFQVHQIEFSSYSIGHS